MDRAYTLCTLTVVYVGLTQTVLQLPLWVTQNNDNDIINVHSVRHDDRVHL